MEFGRSYTAIDAHDASWGLRRVRYEESDSAGHHYPAHWLHACAPPPLAHGPAADQPRRLRPDGWTSADAAGLPILPGLVRYDEIIAGEIRHALRFTAPQTRRAYVWPARHFASDLTGAAYPPLGQRFRLRADFDPTGYSPEVQVILVALQRYGMFLADNGSPWFLSGVPDERWANDALRELRTLRGADFEAVDVGSLMQDPDSGQTSP